MKLTGRFSTTVTPTALLALQRDFGALSRVPGFTDVRIDASGNVRAQFTPRDLFVPMPFALTVEVERLEASEAVLTVQAGRGSTLVDVGLRMEFAAEGAATTVSWAAEVAVRGPGASAGQRVVRDLVWVAIDEVLRGAAAVAA
ncbi:SRPBCC domain-containing protein [Kribbella sp. NPDC051620]|uniref:SRPBCC domain-containing protein n=1 Tax=Kribbella sp. NPDC051620 TaxID=3364120 RepID=UPI003787986D